MIEEHTRRIEISKSIIKRLFEYNETNHLDDEIEFFPFLKIIIGGTLDTCNTSEEQRDVEKQLTEYAIQCYVSSWISQAREDEEEIDEVHEKREALKNFKNIYNNI
jgi:hypothetical protein